MSLNVNDFPLQNGDLINNDNEVVNIVDLLGGTPINNNTVNKNDYPIKSGLVIGSDNKVYDITESLSGIKDDIEDLQEEVETLSSATIWRGVTTTPLTDGATTNPITINGNSYTAKTGDVVEYNSLEFAFDGTAWQQFGASSYEQLTNKPSINNVTLSGNKTASDLGLLPASGDTDSTSDFELGRDNININGARTIDIESGNGGDVTIGNGVTLTSVDGSTLNTGRDITLTPDRNTIINGDGGASITVSDGIEITTDDDVNISLGTDVAITNSGDIDINTDDGNINLGASVSVDVSATETVTVNAMEGVSITGNSSDVNIKATEGGNITIEARATDPDDAGDISIYTPQGLNITGNAGLDIYGREGVTISSLNSPTSLDASDVDITYTNGFEVNWKDATQQPNVVNNIIDFYEDEVEFKTDVTTTNTTFTSTSLVTKNYVDTNTINEAIVDVTVLPTGSNIKDVVYRLTTDNPETIPGATETIEIQSDSGFTFTPTLASTGLFNIYEDEDMMMGTRYTAAPKNTLYAEFDETSGSYGDLNYGRLNYIIWSDMNIEITNSVGSYQNTAGCAGTLTLTQPSTIVHHYTYSYYMGDSVNQTTTELSSSPTEPTAQEIAAYEQEIFNSII